MNINFKVVKIKTILSNHYFLLVVCVKAIRKVDKKAIRKVDKFAISQVVMELRT